MSFADRRIVVVMITYNRRQESLASLERLARLPEQPRIVVVDNGSTDGTAEAIAEAFPAVRIVREHKNLGAAGRNLGVQAVDAPYVALCDDDVWWAPGALGKAADLFDAHPQLAVVTGKVLVGPEETIDPACLEMAQSPLSGDLELPGRPILGFLAGASAVRRVAFLQCGGFDRRLFLGGEERWMAAELACQGWQLRYVPEILVHHWPSAQRDAARRRWHEVRNAIWFAWRRRPFRTAMTETIRSAGSAEATVAARALLAALIGMPWVLRERRTLPEAVELGFRRLEARRGVETAAGPISSIEECVRLVQESAS
jgi:GT2 family glycosyltransferase